MADLFNQQISATYSGLLKTTSSGVLTSSLTQITDGRGNGSPLYISTAAINFYNAYSFPITDGTADQILSTDGAGAITWVDVSGGDVLKTGTIVANEIAIWNDSVDTLRSDPTLTIDADHKITLYQPNSVPTDRSNYNIGGGNIPTVTGTNNTGFGKDNLLLVSSGNSNVAFGRDALKQNTTGYSNVSIGHGSLQDNTDGNTNIAIGSFALSNNTNGWDNIGIGSSALTSMVGSPSGSIAIGSSTLSQSTGWGSIAIGFQSLVLATTGNYNIAIGYQSGNAITTGANNVIIGGNSGSSINTLSNNIIISDGEGDTRILLNTDRKILLYQYNSVDADLSTYNIGGGNVKNVTGNYNTGFGKDNLNSVTTGEKNVAFGYNALTSNTTGSNNVSIGHGSLQNNTSGENNVAIGWQSMNNVSTFNGGNTAIGVQSLYQSTGFQNIALGFNAGNALLSGSYNVIIGSNNGLSINTLSNRIIISDGAGTIRQYINNDGEVGIGTDSPDDSLHVKTSTNGKGLTLQVNSVTEGDYSQLSFLPSTSELSNSPIYIRGIRGTSLVDSYLTLNTNSLPRLTITSGGKVGINNTIPSSFFGNASQLVVGDGSTSRGITIYSSTAADGQIFFADGTTGADQYRGMLRYEHSSNALVFFTNAAEKMRIADTGAATFSSSVTATSGTFVGLVDILNSTLPLRIVNTIAASNQQSWIKLRQSQTNLFGFDIGIDTTTGGDFFISRANGSDTINEAFRIARATGAATFSSTLSLNSASDPSAGFLLFKYMGNTASRTWKVSNDQSNYGDFVIQVSTTQAGSAFITPLQIQNTGAATFSSSIVSTQLAINTTPSDMVNIVNVNSSGRQGIRLNNGINATSGIVVFNSASSTGTETGGLLRIHQQSASLSQPSAIFRQEGSADILQLQGAAGALRLTISSGGTTTASKSDAGTLIQASSSSGAGSGIINFFSSMSSTSNNTNCSHFKGTTQGVNSWYLHGNGSSTWSSDSRLKKDIETTRDGYIDDIKQLRVVKYKWKNDPNSALELGLIAQEVENIFPSLVVDHKNAIGDEVLYNEEDEIPNGKKIGDVKVEGTTYKGVKYSVLPMILLKAIQEQQTIIEDLKSRIEKLEV